MANEIKLGNTSPLLSNVKSHTKVVTADEKSAHAASTPNVDRVSVTETASRLQKFEEELGAMPGIDHARVAAIKQAIADGSLTLDPHRIAEKLLGFEASFKR